jgi:hypothetical protein
VDDSQRVQRNRCWLGISSFQLYGDVTGNLCRKNVDLIDFGVNSIPKHKIVLCLGVIPKGTESENNYEITWDDFRTAAVLTCSYKDCGKPGCEICGTIMEVLSADDVQAYTCSKKFREGQLPVETTMCDNFKGWDNFSHNALGIPSNVCFLHGTGNFPHFNCNVPHS